VNLPSNQHLALSLLILLYYNYNYFLHNPCSQKGLWVSVLAVVVAAAAEYSLPERAAAMTPDG
jgi:hypothetical protein